MFSSNMDDSMNSVHSISAMDISPASSPRTALGPIVQNHLVLNAFQQQQQSLSNILFSAPNRNDYSCLHKDSISDENDVHTKSVCLFTTVLTDNHLDNQPQLIPDESNIIRQRIVTEAVSSVVEPVSTIKKSPSNSSRQSFSKILFLLIPILLLLIYLILQHFNTSLIQPRSSNWQNASDYLTKHLTGQDQGLEAFKDAMNQHRNFSIVIIEGPTGSGKSYLASSLEKFIPTTLISSNTLLGLSTHHWTESDRLTSYLLSYLSPSTFQFLIIDDLDLLSTNETYCHALTTALHSIHTNKNLFILLLHTGTMPNKCQENFDNITTKSIKFDKLQRSHIRICIQNEAYTQNVQPPFDDRQLETILDSLQYITDQGISYGTTGCKEIPSRVMLATKNTRNDN